MTRYEKNPYYWGTGKYKGDEGFIYYDYRQKEWSAELFKNGQVFSDIKEDDIEFG